MDWLSIVIIAAIVIGLILLYGLTGTGMAINCRDKSILRNKKHFKDRESEEDVGRE